MERTAAAQAAATGTRLALSAAQGARGFMEMLSKSRGGSGGASTSAQHEVRRAGCDAMCQQLSFSIGFLNQSVPYTTPFAEFYSAIHARVAVLCSCKKGAQPAEHGNSRGCCRSEGGGMQ